MYLLVFVTLVISVIGLYTQTFALQTARIMSRQTGFANAMLTWHGTALAVAHYSVDATPGPPAGTTPNYNKAAGCSLSAIGGTNLPPPCLTAGNKPATVGLAAPPAGMQNCDSEVPISFVPPCWRTLPLDYASTIYPFFSIAYQWPAPKQNYVITFVPPPLLVTPSCPINNFVCLPGTTAPPISQVQLGITLSDLYNQLRHTSTPTLAYGTVTNGFVVTAGVSNVGPTLSTLQFPVPTTGALGSEVPEGSLAIISTPDPCTGC
jgi:hypothetical protein